VLEGSWEPTRLEGWSAKRKWWIGENDLLIRRCVFTSVHEGKTSVETIEMSNVKVDGKIDPKEFEYVPPVGAVVEDQTKGN
jgi:outer membrane lipoprotein-sorting protein